MYEVINAFLEVGFMGTIRLDHGRVIWVEKGRLGYGLYDLALGFNVFIRVLGRNRKND